MSYVKFAKYQRGQCLKSVKLAVNDTKEIRVNDDTFTAEEVEEIIEAVHESVTSEVETELINSAHTNILLLKQLFTQAEKWHLNLDTDMSELENRYDVISTLSAFSIYFAFIFLKYRDLLDAVKKWEEQELSGSKVSLNVFLKKSFHKL